MASCSGGGAGLGLALSDIDGILHTAPNTDAERMTGFSPQSFDPIDFLAALMTGVHVSLNRRLRQLGEMSNAAPRANRRAGFTTKAWPHARE